MEAIELINDMIESFTNLKKEAQSAENGFVSMGLFSECPYQRAKVEAFRLVVDQLEIRKLSINKL